MNNKLYNRRAVCVTTGTCIFIDDDHDLSMFDPEKNAVLFRGGVHEISGMTIGGQIVLTNSAVVHGTNVTINLRSGRRVPKEHWRDVLPKQSFFRRLFGLPHKDEAFLVNSPYIVRGNSTLNIPEVTILVDSLAPKSHAGAIFEGSRINVPNRKYSPEGGGCLVTQKIFGLIVGGRHPGES